MQKIRKGKNILILLVLSGFFLQAGTVIADDNNQNIPAVPDIKTIKVLDLKTAGQIALAKSPNYATALLRIKQAKERIKQAKSAFMPRLDTSASATHSYRFGEVSQFSDRSTQTYRIGIEATYTLFDGFDRRFSKAAARHGEKMSQASQENSKRLLLSSVSSSYFGAQLAYESISISKADKIFYEQKLAEAKARRSVGAGSLSDELNFQIRVNSSKADLIKAENNYLAAMTGLAALLGIEESVFPARLTLAALEKETSEEMSQPNFGNLVGFAIENRPDLLEKEIGIKQADARVKVSQASLYPTASLFSSIDGSRNDNTGFEEEDFGASVGVRFSYNIYSGGYRPAKIAEIKLQKRELRKYLEALLITINHEVRSSIIALRSAQEQLKIQRLNVALVKRNRDLVEKEYAAGQSSLVRLNEAQRDVTAAQTSLAVALVNLHKAWSELDTSSGKIVGAFEAI